MVKRLQLHNIDNLQSLWIQIVKVKIDTKQARISGGMLNKIKYIAAYQTQHVSAIMQSASVDRIESYGDEWKSQSLPASSR